MDYGLDVDYDFNHSIASSPDQRPISHSYINGAFSSDTYSNSNRVTGGSRPTSTTGAHRGMRSIDALKRRSEKVTTPAAALEDSNTTNNPIHSDNL